MGSFKKYLGWLSLVGLVSFTLLMIFYPAMSTFSAGIVKTGIGILLLHQIDSKVFVNLDSREEISRMNLAYPLYLLCFAIIIAACLFNV